MLRGSSPIMAAWALCAVLPITGTAGSVPTSTSTTATTTSTTTTLPPACMDEASLDSVGCRLDALAARAATEDLGRFGARLEKNLERAARLLESAEEACRLDDLDKSKRLLKRVIRTMIRAGRGLRSLRARRSLDSAVRTALLGEVTSLVRDSKRLRRILACPLGSPSGAFV